MAHKTERDTTRDFLYMSVHFLSNQL